MTTRNDKSKYTFNVEWDFNGVWWYGLGQTVVGFEVHAGPIKAVIGIGFGLTSRNTKN